MPYKSRSDMREYQQRWLAARRARHIELHGGKCARCGSDRELEFDHVDPAMKVDHRIWSWSESRIAAELQKCQLLCCDCHLEKSIAEMEYPERRHGTNLMYVKAACRCDACKGAHAVTNAKYRSTSSVGLK